jgi:pSer/pThr/pTyr-binding forkhead associated (FHA) protein
MHASVFAVGNGWHIEDFGSTNGSYVSGRPVHGTSPIENGEMIQFGRVRMRLLC